MCITYRKLSVITKPYEFLIPRCDDAIAIIDTGSQCTWIISLDARQGYHQITIRKIDWEKLTFFSPDGWKYTFKVMPFGPTNAPAFHSAMTKNMKDEWNDLFIVRLRELSSIGVETVFISATMEIYICNRKIVSGTKIIINSILLRSSNICALFVYL